MWDLLYFTQLSLSNTFENLSNLRSRSIEDWKWQKRTPWVMALGRMFNTRTFLSLHFSVDLINHKFLVIYYCSSNFEKIEIFKFNFLLKFFKRFQFATLIILLALRRSLTQKYSSKRERRNIKYLFVTISLV